MIPVPRSANAAPKARRLPASLLFAACIVALSLTTTPDSGADQLFGKQCNKSAAQGPFLDGFNFYWKKSGIRRPHTTCDDAIPLFEKAAEMCPDPGSPWVLPWKPLIPVSYVPFYYLGDCHSQRKDQRKALQQFYISRCVGEPERDQEATKDLGRFTAECRRDLEGRRRPGQYPPEFGAGFKAADLAGRRGAKKKDWENAADEMWTALQIQKEDGGKFRDNRYIALYFPRLRLGEALFHLGCYREAFDQLNQVNAKSLESAHAQEERKLLESLRPQAEGMIKRSYEAPEICQRWNCWLAEGKRK